MIISSVGNVAISSTDNFNIYFSSGITNWNNFTITPTSLWGDGLTTASDQAGDKYLTMRNMMFQAPHIVLGSVGGNAYIRMGRVGGIASGTYWDLATRNDGIFHIAKEQNGSVGICIDTAGNVGLGNEATSAKLDVVGSIRLTSSYPGLFFYDGQAALGWASGAGGYSFTANVGDLVLRSATNQGLILQSGSGGFALAINTNNNVSFFGILNLPQNWAIFDGTYEGSANSIGIYHGGLYGSIWYFTGTQPGINQDISE